MAQLRALWLAGMAGLLASAGLGWWAPSEAQAKVPQASGSGPKPADPPAPKGPSAPSKPAPPGAPTKTAKPSPPPTAPAPKPATKAPTNPPATPPSASATKGQPPPVRVSRGNAAKPRRAASWPPRAAAPRPKPRLPGSEPGKPDEAARSIVTGRYPEHSTAPPVESPALKAMRELDRVLFPPAPAPTGVPWSQSLRLPEPGPSVDASGLPSPAAPGSADAPTTASAPAPDRSWLAKLVTPDLPIPLEPSVVRYLEYYRDDPRGQRLVGAWVKKSGRYRGAIVKLLRQYMLPEDVLWLALVESGFDPAIHSHAGAAGLWQFVPATARIYGLTVSRAVDERLDPERSTHAALKHLKDLYQRFGTWELAFAAYNMGYGGLLAAIRKYNTNDFWELRRLEAALPYETALYVPKIMAMAVVARNCQLFGCDSVGLDPPEPFGDVAVDRVSLAPGVMLLEVARATGERPETLAALNPQLIGTRLPPLGQSALPRSGWPVYVPEGKGALARSRLPAQGRAEPLATVRLRWGEPLAHVAARYRTSTAVLERLNDLHPGESPRPDTELFVPVVQPRDDPSAFAATHDEAAAVVPLPDHEFVYPGRRRVFYQAVFGDSAADLAPVVGASAADIRRWNHLDARATLQDGMFLQLFLPPDAAVGNVLLLEEAMVKPVAVESGPFFAHVVGRGGRERIEVTARAGNTFRALATRYGLSVGMLERINHRSRHGKLEPGDKVIVYAKRSLVEAAGAGGKRLVGEAADADGERGDGPAETVAPGPETGGATAPGAAIDLPVSAGDSPAAGGEADDGDASSEP